jgi:isopentenyl phosphate kinase
MVAKNGEPETVFWQPLLQALALGLTPVVYGDVVLDRRWGATIASTEAVLGSVARWLQERRSPGAEAEDDWRIRQILWFGETDGILDRDGGTIRRVSDTNLQAVRAAIDAPRGADVTGGMALRLETAWRLAQEGFSSRILDGRQPGLLERVLRLQDDDDAEGTLVVGLPGEAPILVTPNPHGPGEETE